jgi:DNA anti-recombination protein RmuC
VRDIADFTERSMAKQLWLALGLGLAASAGVVVALAGPGVTWAQATPEQLSTVGIAGGVTAALLVMFVAVFLGLATIDGADMRWARRRIDALVADARDGLVIEPDEFVAAMGKGVLGDSAKSYGATLRPGAWQPDTHGEARYAGGDPVDFFTPEALIDDRLYLTAFRRLPTVLILISAATLAFGLCSLLGDYSRGAALAALAADGQAVLIACGFPLFAAIVVGAIVPAVVAVRRRQLAGLIGRIGLLFHGTDERFEVRRLLEAQSSGAADLRRTLASAVGEIKKLFESLRRRVEDQAAPAGGNLSAFEHSLKASLADLSQATTRLAEDQDRAVARLVQESLAGFSAELGRTLGTQLEAMRQTLTSTEAAAASLERSLGGVARAADEPRAVLDISAAAIELKLDHVVERLSEVAETVGARADDAPGERPGTASEVERKLDLVVERLTEVVAALGVAAERRGEAAEGSEASAGWVVGGAAIGDRLEQLSNALTIQATESAAAIKQLHATVDSLCLSVAPVLNRLADTQEDLLAALSGENTTSRLLADVAEDLRQLSRTNRDTLDRHMQLATELAKVGQVLEGMATGIPTRPAPAAKVSDALMRALQEFRSETDAASSRLPGLDPAA